MSKLTFNGLTHQLTLKDSSGKEVGSWHANNVVDSKVKLRYVPNRTYLILDSKQPHKHGGSADSLNGPYGTYGIIRIQNFSVGGGMHSGVGIHAGRKNKGGPDHATHGCIRTSEEAMAALVEHMKTDPILTLTVEANHDQRNKTPHHKADKHAPLHQPSLNHQS